MSRHYEKCGQAIFSWHKYPTLHLHKPRQHKKINFLMWSFEALQRLGTHKMYKDSTNITPRTMLLQIIISKKALTINSTRASKMDQQLRLPFLSKFSNHSTYVHIQHVHTNSKIKTVNDLKRHVSAGIQITKKYLLKRLSTSFFIRKI